MNRLVAFLTFINLSFGVTIGAEVGAGFNGKTLSLRFEEERTKTVGLNFLLSLPENYSTEPGSSGQGETVWPLLIYLHGAGIRGDDLDLLYKNGPPKLLRDGNSPAELRKAIVVSPQCPEGAWWSKQLMIESLDFMLERLIQDYRVDESRIYLTGLSMGG